MTMQQAVLSSWGKSTAVRIPSTLLKKSGWHTGQKVTVQYTNDGNIVLCPAPERPKLEALLERVTPDNLPDDQDIDWGKPVGTEVW